MNFKDEIEDLKRRVADLEGAVDVLAGKFNSVHPEIVSLKAATEHRFAGLQTGLGRLAKKLDDMNTQVWSLRDDFPELISDALKAAMK